VPVIGNGGVKAPETYSGCGNGRNGAMVGARRGRSEVVPRSARPAAGARRARRRWTSARKDPRAVAAEMT
jgi:hypothetical protein